MCEWLQQHPETQALVHKLEHVLEAATVLIMSKQRNAALADFRALNLRQIHAILSQYQPQQQQGENPKAGGFPVVPSGLSKSSQEIVDKIEKAKVNKQREKSG